MKKQRQLSTSFSVDNIDAVKISKKFSNLLDDAVPNNVLGMLALAYESDGGIVFYDRYKLVPHQKQDYEIIDIKRQTSLYKNITLFTSALNIIFYLNKPIRTAGPIDSVIYNLDQEYFRCTENIKFFQKKSKIKDIGRAEFFAIQLINYRMRLVEIKSLLSKKY